MHSKSEFVVVCTDLSSFINTSLIPLTPGGLATWIGAEGAATLPELARGPLLESIQQAMQ
jgi:hypothetical protein